MPTKKPAKPKPKGKLPRVLKGFGTRSGSLNWVEVLWSAVCEVPVIIVGAIASFCLSLEPVLPFLLIQDQSRGMLAVACFVYLILFALKISEMRRADNANGE